MTKKIFINSEEKYDGLSSLADDIQQKNISDIKTLVEKLRKFVRSQKQWVQKGPLYDSPQSYSECKVLILLGESFLIFPKASSFFLLTSILLPAICNYAGVLTLDAKYQ